MTAQIAVEEEQAFGLQLEEHGVDELHDIVAPQAWQQAVESGCEHDASQLARATAHVDIAGIVFPEVAVGDDGHLVAQLAQAFGQRGVDIAIFAYQEYFHRSFFMRGMRRMRRLRPLGLPESRRNQVYFLV